MDLYSFSHRSKSKSAKGSSRSPDSRDVDFLLSLNVVKVIFAFDGRVLWLSVSVGLFDDGYYLLAS